MFPLLATGLTGLVASRFQEIYQQDFDFTNIDLATNIDITDQLAVTKAISQNPASTLIHFSPNFVFDGHSPPPGGYTEASPPHPVEWYGLTKLWAEQEVQKSGAKYCIVRITYPFR